MKLALVWITLFRAGLSCALRLARLDVPSAVVLGEPTWLNCSYDLESDELYSVKWYKNNVEFYRFLPSDRPPGQKYDLKGVFVDLSKSEHGNVYLSRATLQTEGTYRCEVSAEAPSFQTVREEGTLAVYVLPPEGPTIVGVRPQYRVGDLVNVTCTVGPSKPAATLRWYINGREAPAELEFRPEGIPRGPGKLQTAGLGLTFVTQPAHVRRGAMKLRCTAVIAQAYSKSSEEVVLAAPQGGPAGDGPIITGGRAKYQVGDVVDVNCTSAKSRPRAELLWFVNDRVAGPGSLVRYLPLRYADGEETSILGLRFSVAPSHFQNDEMRLKCTATLSQVLNMSSEEIAGSSRQSSGLHVSEHRIDDGRNCAFVPLALPALPLLLLMLVVL